MLGMGMRGEALLPGVGVDDSWGDGPGGRGRGEMEGDGPVAEC